MKKKSLFELNEKVLRSSFTINFGVQIAQNNRAKLHHTLQYSSIRKQSVHWVPAGLVFKLLGCSN